MKFTNMYSRFQKPILKYVRTRVKDPQVAEEITQEVFIKAYRFQDSYDEKHAAISTWLWTIARNTVVDNLRKKDVSFEEPLCEDEIPSLLFDAESLLEKRDRRRMLMMMTRQLSKVQRRVLWMRVVQQRSYDEIAKHLGVSLGAVKTMVHRAKNTMIAGFDSMPELGFA